MKIGTAEKPILPPTEPRVDRLVIPLKTSFANQTTIEFEIIRKDQPTSKTWYVLECADGKWSRKGMDVPVEFVFSESGAIGVSAPDATVTEVADILSYYRSAVDGQNFILSHSDYYRALSIHESASQQSIADAYQFKLFQFPAGPVREFINTTYSRVFGTPQARERYERERLVNRTIDAVFHRWAIEKRIISAAASLEVQKREYLRYYDGLIDPDITKVVKFTAAEVVRCLRDEPLARIRAIGHEGIRDFVDRILDEKMGSSLESRHEIELTDSQAELGCRYPLTRTHPRTETFHLVIPPHTQCGATMRVTGQGLEDLIRPIRGDLIVSVVDITPIPDQESDLRVDKARARYGGIETVTEWSSNGVVLRTISLNIPPGTKSGNTLRFKGQGFKDQLVDRRGDLVVTVTVNEPEPHISPELQDLMIRMGVDLDLKKKSKPSEYMAKRQWFWGKIISNAYWLILAVVILGYLIYRMLN